MTALKHEAIQLVEQLSKEQMPYIIQYIRWLSEEGNKGRFHDNQVVVTPKMKAFQELEDMLFPVSQELDYDKELAEAKDKKHGYFG